MSMVFPVRRKARERQFAASLRSASQVVASVSAEVGHRQARCRHETVQSSVLVQSGTCPWHIAFFLLQNDNSFQHLMTGWKSVRDLFKRPDAAWVSSHQMSPLWQSTIAYTSRPRLTRLPCTSALMSRNAWSAHRVTRKVNPHCCE